MGLSGLEPPTSRLSGVRSNRLSYKPSFKCSGGLLFSHAVSSIVSSAAHVLTFVFGMGTGVSHERITTGTSSVIFPHSPSGSCFLDNQTVHSSPYFFFLRKEVIQPHLPIRLPCYDFTPVTGSTFDGSVLSVRSPASGISDSHGVTGGVYKTRERIHRDMLIRDY